MVCTPFDRTGSLVALSTEAKKFSWGEEFQARVRVKFIVILEPRRLHRLLDQPDLLGGWPAATALNRGNHFNAGRRTILIGGHSRNHRRMPMPYRATLPVRSKRGAVQRSQLRSLLGR